MIKQHHFDNKRLLSDDDDEQIEKTLNFFDSILNQYLTDQDKIEENNDSIQRNSTKSNHTTNSSSSSSSSSSAGYIPPPQFRQHIEQKPYVRRYTSDNNLNQIVSSSSSSSKSKPSHSRLLQTTATSTENLSIIPSHNHLSNFMRKTNLLSSNGATASLIDLSSIDKLSSKRPHYRFIPPSNDNYTLKEEPEIEQQFQLKTISSDQKSFNNQIKSSHKIVKPTVIIPSTPKSAPISRLTETSIHHQNENSAFKPHRSSKTAVSQIKRTESIQKSNVNMGITNHHNHLSNFHHQQPPLQSHQSMLNLSSIEPIKKTRYEPRISYQPKHVYPSTRPVIPENPPIPKWISPANNPSNINSLHHTYPYSSFIPLYTGISSSMNNHRPPTYYNSKNLPKYHTSQYPSAPISSNYLVPPSTKRINGQYPLSSSSNIYNFNQNHSPRDEQIRRNYNRQNVKITTYL